tara:strand:- start:458 stop:589 length:132 start_codon:yes stop_codon:yes gene_type:complete
LIVGFLALPGSWLVVQGNNVKHSASKVKCFGSLATGLQETWVE